MIAADPNTGQDHTQLVELARPFPSDLIEHKEHNDYVAHPIVNQRLLSVVGPFDFELVREIRGDVPAVPPDPSAKSRRGKAGTPALSNVIVGVVGRLTCEIDGRRTVAEEAGDVGDVHNWAHDGARLKDAASDALKRCAMRLGLGLHLWSKGHYFLDQQLAAQFAPPQESAAAQESEPDGASAARDDAGSSARPDAEPAKAPDPTQGPVADGTPPGFDLSHLGLRALQAWLRGQPPELRALVEVDAKAQGIDLAEANKETLHELIAAAWKAKEAA